jgi:hypothetical protein
LVGSPNVLSGAVVRKVSEDGYPKIGFTQVFPDDGVVDDRGGGFSDFRGDEAKGIPVLQNFQKMDVVHDIFIRVHKMPPRSGMSDAC